MIDPTRQMLTQLALTTLVAMTVATGSAAQGNGNGNGNGSNSSPDIECRIEIPDPATLGSSGGELRSDHANNTNEYSSTQNTVDCVAGRNRNLYLGLSKHATRRLVLDLGSQLPGMPGDNPAGLPVVSFGPSIPNPSHGPDGVPNTADDGEISDVELRIGARENVSALGAFPNTSFPPNYCWPDNSEIPDAQVDPNNPLTFRRMCTNMRLSFKVGAHQWRMFFGSPNRRIDQAFQRTQWDTGPVVVERIFPNWSPNADPTDPTVPWRITVEPWQTTNMLHPRYGMVVGYLHYRGTKRQDPYRYVGTFDVSWASADPNVTPWLAYPIP